jgi:hypothetical protein
MTLIYLLVIIHINNKSTPIPLVHGGFYTMYYKDIGKF